MSNNLSDLLRLLTETPGIPGMEHTVRKLIVDQVIDECEEVYKDPLGNLITTSGHCRNYSIGVLAHMDEVGMMVNKILTNGLVGFTIVGNIEDRLLLGRDVDLVNNESKVVKGVIGSVSRHLQSAEDIKKEVSHKNLWIDIGASSMDEVFDAGIEIGTAVVFSSKYHQYGNGIISGKAFDDRAGCAVLIHTIKRLKNKLKNMTLYGMFTIQEEIGAKGAQVVAFDKRPNLTITLDTVPTQNVNTLSPNDVDLNRGPVIRLFDWHPSTKFGMYTHPLIKDRLLEVAKRQSIDYQTDVLTSTYLDSSHVHLTASGIPGGSICIPRRYAHNPVELCHLMDIEKSIQLLVGFIESLDSDPIKFDYQYK